LQAAEKMLKAALTERGVRYSKGSAGHDLVGLRQLVTGINIPVALIDQVKCSAKVRYNEEPSTLEQAEIAHRASLRICDLVATRCLWSAVDQRTRRLAPRIETRFS
jgi:hypothetical protein